MDTQLAETGALTDYASLAKRIDHSLVRPELTRDEVAAGCESAREYGVASVSVRPSDIELAVRMLDGSGVAVGSVAGFPHGSSTTAVKLYEVRDALRRGAREIDAVINIGNMRSREFQHVETEIEQMAAACHEQGALLKVIFENAYLTDEQKVVACRICSRCRVDFVKTSTGITGGYTAADLQLMRKHTDPWVGVKAAGGVRTLDLAIEVSSLGATRIGATKTVEILTEWKRRIAAAAGGSHT